MIYRKIRHIGVYLITSFLVLISAVSKAEIFEIEVGSRVSADTFVSLDQTYVSFDKSFQEPPVVIALIDQRGGNAAMLRITNVSTAGFFAVITEPEGYDGEHLSVNFDYIAMTPGTYRLPTGEVIAAGRLVTSAVQHGAGVSGPESWATATFGDTLSSTATVLADTQSANNESNAIPDQPAAPFMTAAIRNPTASTVELAIERSESSLGSITQPETIGWIAFPSGTNNSFTDINGTNINWSALTTAANVRGWSDGCFTNAHGVNSANAVVIAKKNTHNEDDGGWFRSCSKSATTIGLRVDEDIANDSERSHVGESAGIISFSQPFHAQFSQQEIRGSVFEDNGAGAGTAYDAVQSGAETGLGNRLIELASASTGTVLASTATQADGSFTLDIPDAAIGQQVRLSAGLGVNYRGVSEAPGAVPSLNNPDNFDNGFLFTPARYDIYTDNRFGQIEGPTLTEDRDVTVAAGGSVRLRHRYEARAEAAVDFTVNTLAEAQAGEVLTTLYHDANCSGELDSGETVFSAPVNVNGGDVVCVILSLAAGEGLSTGGVFSYELAAQTNLAGISLVLNDTNIDTLTIGASGLLSLSKQVCNLTVGTCNALDGTGFVFDGTGSPGDVVQYRIVFQVTGPDTVESVSIFDVTPDFSALVPGTAVVAQDLVGLSCSHTTPAGGGTPGYEGPVEWACTGSGANPGERGIVTFDVMIDN
jgi:hypothetical protein